MHPSSSHELHCMLNSRACMTERNSSLGQHRTAVGIAMCAHAVQHIMISTCLHKSICGAATPNSWPCIIILFCAYQQHMSVTSLCACHWYIHCCVSGCSPHGAIADIEACRKEAKVCSDRCWQQTRNPSKSWSQSWGSRCSPGSGPNESLTHSCTC